MVWGGMWLLLQTLYVCLLLSSVSAVQSEGVGAGRSTVSGGQRVK